MKIRTVSKFIPDAAPVLILRGKNKVSKHPLFNLLPEKDREQLRLFEKHTHPVEGEYLHTVFLPHSRRAFIIGVGDRFNHRRAILAVRKVIDAARRERIGELVVNFDDFATDRKIELETLAEVMAVQFEMANFEFVSYKASPKEGWFFVKQTLIYAESKKTLKIQQALQRGKIIGEEINDARILSNTPGGDMTPQKLAEAAKRAGKRAGFKVKVLGEAEIKKLQMGGVLGVSRGSAERPRFIIMEYLKGKKGDKPIVLVGKGVTFDTGGLNLKPEQAIYEMHMDMSGGAAVIHTIAAMARLKVKKNIVGLVPAVENMPSGSSYHPGDLLKTMSGKTIEVLNTDAEGRVILADALTYAQKYKPRLVIDIATLTGAAVVALGQRASAIFTVDHKLEEQLRESGEITGDFVWPLPLWGEYEEDIKGTFGDVANVGKTRYGGAITGAVFLWQFIKDYPWVHIDIAPRMTSIEGEFLSRGAAGASIGLLSYFLRKF